ncbi:uncharacterized protein NEMAJ01_0161 [Nematocida major]|uniref:uncharacterized protein n=1 Tax=Nematocida major TaxID=1912982 RepID=UPI002007AF9C|nr:uncharacterized protein NEMAJ01_0161 [Nematocida major]KAH9385265.1 hypothetical protein NEMAJ01_0161 [Nematocida major]
MGIFVSKPQERIRIATKNIKGLEMEVYTRKTIIHLYLCKDHIVSLHRNIVRLRSLRVLQICCNSLSALPKEIGQLKNLSILFLSRNNLREIPSELSLLKDLSDLNISDNQITGLPESLENLKSLKILDMSGNPVESLPPVVSRIKSLACISLLRTRIAHLPPSLLQLPFLTELNYKSCSAPNIILANKNTSLLETVLEHTIQRTKYVKRMLPLGVLKHIGKHVQCDICGKQIYNPIVIYTSIVIACSQVPVKYIICKSHKIDRKDPCMSIRKSLFMGEVQSALPAPAPAGDVVHISEVCHLVNRYLSPL